MVVVVPVGIVPVGVTGFASLKLTAPFPEPVFCGGACVVCLVLRDFLVELCMDYRGSF